MHKKVRDGAIGLEDQWLAPTEEGFMSSETSNSAAPRGNAYSAFIFLGEKKGIRSDTF